MMLVEKSNKVFSDLSSSTDLVALLTNGITSIRPLIAEYEDGDSFVTYAIRYTGVLSKENRAGYSVLVRSFASEYDKSLAIADAVAAAFNNAEGYTKYVSAAPNFSEQNEIYTEQVFNLK